MADIKVQPNEGPKVEFEHHARDYSRMIKMLKYGAVASFILAMLVMLIIAR